jgi:hypothetical protein
MDMFSSRLRKLVYLKYFSMKEYFCNYFASLSNLLRCRRLRSCRCRRRRCIHKHFLRVKKIFVHNTETFVIVVSPRYFATLNIYKQTHVVFVTCVRRYRTILYRMVLHHYSTSFVFVWWRRLVRDFVACLNV